MLDDSFGHYIYQSKTEKVNSPRRSSISAVVGRHLGVTLLYMF